MKHTLFILFVGCLMHLQGQVSTPKLSPKSKVEQVVGMTNVTIEYSRPSKRGRNIFGDLVPYDKIWRTGANENTKISFEHDVEIEGKKLSKGTYAIYSIPGLEKWEFIFYKKTNNWGVPKDWNEGDIALRINVTPIKINENIESFLINLGELTVDGCSIELLWDNIIVPIKLKVPSRELALKSIEKVLAGPTYNDYYQGASYYRNTGLDINQAEQYIKKSIEIGGNKRFWILREYSLILAEQGKYKQAINQAKKSIELAEKAGNTQYIKFNKEAINKWKKML